jgi:multidrug transporter EmrE-like cation transporter
MDKSASTALPFAPASAASKAASWAPALFGAVVLAGCGHLIIKFGLNRIRASEASGAAAWLNPWLFFGLGIYGVGTLLWIFAVSRKQINYLYPITALNYAIVAFGGRLFFQERVPPTRLLGIAIVIAGVILMQWSEKGPSSTPSLKRAEHPPLSEAKGNECKYRESFS